MINKNDKKGLSGVIVVMLLIAFAIVAVVIIGSVVLGLFGETEEGMSLQSRCSGVSLGIEDIKNNADWINVTVQKRTGASDIQGFKATFSDGEDSVDKIAKTGTMGTNSIRTLRMNTTDLQTLAPSDVKRVIVSPYINNTKGEEMVCTFSVSKDL